MRSLDPFKLLYSLMGYSQELWRKNFISRWFRRRSRSSHGRNVSSGLSGLFGTLGGLKKFFLVRWISSFWLSISILPRMLDSRLRSLSRKSVTFRSIGKLFAWLFQFSLVEPTRWMIQISGTGIQWFITRRWAGILVAIMPSLLLVGVVFATWYGGRLARRGVLAGWYRELGDEEMRKWEADLAGAERPENLLTGNAETGGDGSDQSLAPQISPYGELLFRRIQLLDPNQESQIMIAISMMQRGAISSGQAILKRSAPDDRVGHPKAHALMAMSYLIEFMKSRDSTILPVFEHHAEASMRFGGTQKEVLLMYGDLQWQKGNRQRALEIYQRAAAVAPELNIVVFQRALSIGQKHLADRAQQLGVQYLQQMLARDPNNDEILIKLVALISTTEAGINQAEEMILKAQSVRPSPTLTRAVSELYRMRFLHAARANQSIAMSMIYLDKAMVTDPSNPNVAEYIELMIREGSSDREELQKGLNEMLVSGRATTGTHAMLAELHLIQNDRNQAILHLKQVFQVTPSAVKYANLLAQSFAAEGELEQALETALATRDTLLASKKMHEKYVDDLLNTLGTIYEKLDRDQEAIDAYLACLEMNPNRSDTRRQLAALYRHRGDEQNASLQESLAERVEMNKRGFTAFQSVPNKENEADGPPPQEDSTPNEEQGSVAPEAADE